MNLNEPVVKTSSVLKTITSIWVVPFIALLIGAWLLYEHFSKQGPEIRILFPNNEGLVAGQSLIKYKNVPIGRVSKIELNPEIEGVFVYAKLDKFSKPYINNTAKFWIVKPEVGVTGVSGLETILSGTYINVISKVDGTFQSEHVGLDKPYRDTSGGEYFKLITKKSNNVVVGMPIYFQSLVIGHVDQIYMDLDDKSVSVLLFVQKEYTKFINQKSRFWMKSAFSLDVMKGKLDIEIASLNQLLRGAILFSSPDIPKGEEALPAEHTFYLYANEIQALADGTYQSASNNYLKTFLLRFQGKMANISQEAKVKFNDLPIGKVKQTNRYFDLSNNHMVAEVIIEVDLAHFAGKEEKSSQGEQNFFSAIDKGLRAQVIPGFVGHGYVDFTFEHSEGSGKVVESNSMLYLPTLTKSMTANVNNVLASADTTLRELRKTLQGLNGKKGLFNTMTKTTQNLNTTLKTFQSNSRFMKDTNYMINNFSRSAKSLDTSLKILNTQTLHELNKFLKLINDKPNSIVFGK